MRLLISLLIFSLLSWNVSAQEDGICKDLSDLIALEAGQHSSLIQLQENILTANYDLKYHRLEWEVNPAVNYIKGKVHSYFIPTEPAVQQINFDFVNNMTVNHVWYHGQELTFSFTGNDNLQINLPAPLPMGILDSLMVDYEGAPNSTGFGSFETTIHAGVPLMWTLSEPYGAKVWWPCKQDLNDKIDSIDVLVTTPMPYRAASNGVLVEEAVSGNTVRYHWRHRYPIPAYLIAFAVTDYATFSDYVYLPDGDSIEILNYVFHPDLIQGQNELSSTVEIMELYNELFGLYPFADEKYGHAQFGWGGGMEHQTMSFMGGFSYGLQAHELAHQWFGDKVTCGSWEDIWLNEGFATYLTGLTSLYLGTPQEWESWKTNNLNNIISEPDGSVWVDDTTSVGRIFSGRLSYKKGAYVLHMLRWQLGDDAFYQGLQNYLNDPALAYGYARTPDLKQHLEASSGQDLEVFFDQWFYGEGFPSYHAIWEPTSNGIRIQINQTTSDPSNAFFQMPVPVRVNGSGLDTILRLDHQFSGQVFEIELPVQPLSLEVDPEKWLISGNNTVEMASVGTEVWSEMGLHVVLAPNPVSSHLQVYARSSDQAFSLKIYDLVGRLMYESNSEQTAYFIPIQNWQSGLYLVQLGKDGKTITHKIYKQ